MEPGKLLHFSRFHDNFHQLHTVPVSDTQTSQPHHRPEFPGNQRWEIRESRRLGRFLGSTETMVTMKNFWSLRFESTSFISTPFEVQAEAWEASKMLLTSYWMATLIRGPSPPFLLPPFYPPSSQHIPPRQQPSHSMAATDSPSLEFRYSSLAQTKQYQWV